MCPEGVIGSLGAEIKGEGASNLQDGSYITDLILANVDSRSSGRFDINGNETDPEFWRRLFQRCHRKPDVRITGGPQYCRAFEICYDFF
jgi:hypothetical protein